MLLLDWCETTLAYGILKSDKGGVITIDLINGFVVFVCKDVGVSLQS